MLSSHAGHNAAGGTSALIGGRALFGRDAARVGKARRGGYTRSFWFRLVCVTGTPATLAHKKQK